MKAFLLAAGLGTRLRPLTDKTPKCLLPIGGKPLLEIWLDHLAESGVDHVLINTHHLAEQVVAFAETRNAPPRPRLVYEKNLLGSGGTIYRFRDFVAGEKAFWVIYGDNLSTVNLKEMRAEHERAGLEATIGLFRSTHPEACGIATLGARGLVASFEEKPEKPRGNLANGGVYLLNTSLLDELKWDFSPPVDFGFHILPQMVGRMQGYRINGYHRDIGTPDNYARAQREYPGIQSTQGREAFSAGHGVTGEKRPKQQLRVVG